MAREINIDDIILEELLKKDFCSSIYLSEIVDASEKTIREHIKYLDEILENNGAKINTVFGKGYQLEITDQEDFDDLFVDGKILYSKIPVSANERPDYIVTYLLFYDQFYIDFYQLCEEMNVSESVVNKDLRAARKIAENYSLEIVSKRKEGLRIMGDELNIRMCMTNYLGRAKTLDLTVVRKINRDKAVISKIVLDVLKKEKASIPESSLEMLINYTYISKHRIKREHLVKFPEKDLSVVAQADPYAVKVCKQICDRLEEAFGYDYNEDERNCILMFIMGHRINKGVSAGNYNIVVPSEFMELGMNALDFVYKTFHIDLRNDFALLTILCTHLVPLSIRLKYNMSAENKLLPEIRKNCAIGYTIASQVAGYFESIFKKEIDDDEIGFLAIIFETAIKRKKDESYGRKRNVLLVCEAGMATAQLLSIQYQELFKDEFEKIDTCNVQELDDIDFSDYDYVFSTVPINKAVPLPIFECNFFLNDDEIKRIKEEIRKNDSQWVSRYFRPELFIAGLDAANKEDALKKICSRVAEAVILPEGFLDSVLERERIGSTDFGAGVALSHPCKRMSEESFAALAILNRPIFWGKQEVSVIILLSLSEKEDPDLKKLFTTVSRFITNKEKVRNLIRDPRYETFKTIIDT